jgi:hypothetical protein
MRLILSKAAIEGLVFAAASEVPDMQNLLNHWMIPAEVYRLVAGLKDASVNIWAILFAIMASLISAMLCVAPVLAHALRDTTSASANDSLKEGGRCAMAGRVHPRMRNL